MIQATRSDWDGRTTNTSAANDITQGGQKSAVTHPVSPKTVVLPNNVFGAYEALAAVLQHPEWAAETQGKS